MDGKKLVIRQPIKKNNVTYFSQIIPEFSQAMGLDIRSLVTVSVIWEVSSSLVLSCLKQNETGNADF